MYMYVCMKRILLYQIKMMILDGSGRQSDKRSLGTLTSFLPTASQPDTTLHCQQVAIVYQTTCLVVIWCSN